MKIRVFRLSLLPASARKPEMKAFDLPKSDVDALVAYLSAMKKK